MRKSIAVAHRDSSAHTQSAISEAMLHSMAVHQESYAAKTHKKTIYKGLRAVGAVQCLQGEEGRPGLPGTSQSSPSRLEDDESSTINDPSPSDIEMAPPESSAASVSAYEEDEEAWLPSKMKTASSRPPPSPLPVKKMAPQKHNPGGGFLRFEKPLKAVDPAEWPLGYTREERVLRGIILPSRNKFTVEQLQTAFRYLGGYRRSDVSASFLETFKMYLRMWLTKP
ncbi:uncharacterized protein [Littorina saxatilis]|uniref:uncharacterized protein n=1 Tax=Littorina saxatilis TaxID=31220 RepID=UPI0038B5F1AE